MPKRKTAPEEDGSPSVAPRRSSRQRTTGADDETGSQKSELDNRPSSIPAPKSSTPVAVNGAKPRAAKKQPKEPKQKKAAAPSPLSKLISVITNAATGRPAEGATTRQYWLMKAEPESRIENGVDVAFSIDHLAAKTVPEPWDVEWQLIMCASAQQGIRNYVARNNLRSMKKGDMAFFYHSNCKEPAIVGTMEVVEEHSPDLSAHDPKSAYYDETSKPSDPKWSVVHVVFRRKFAVPIGLKELRTLCGPGQPLEQMQMLKQSRLSVSKVSAQEWEYLMGLLEEREKAKAAEDTE